MQFKFIYRVMICSETQKNGCLWKDT